MQLLANSQLNGFFWDCSCTTKMEWIFNQLEETWIPSFLIALIWLGIANSLKQNPKSRVSVLYFGFLKIVIWTSWCEEFSPGEKRNLRVSSPDNHENHSNFYKAFSLFYSCYVGINVFCESSASWEVISIFCYNDGTNLLFLILSYWQ